MLNSKALLNYTATEGIVLKKSIGSEDYFNMDVFTLAYGKAMFLQRTHVQKPKNPILDVLDHVQMIARLKDATSILLSFKEYTIFERFGMIARDYPTYKRVCQFMNTLHTYLAYKVPNPELYHITIKALNAWNAQKSADLILFKTLFLWIKKEGYPVMQDWYTTRPNVQRSTIHTLLTELEPAPECMSHLPELLEHFMSWIRTSTEIPLYVT